MKIIATILLSVLLILPLSERETHKFYVSVTKIEHVKKEKSLQIISQIFIDDLENVIRKRYNESATLALKNESPEINDYIKKYLKAKIKITINGQAVPFEFIGKEYENDITYCYLEILNVTDITSFTIENKVLFDLFEEQENIVRTHINDKHKSFILVSGNDKGVLNFD